MGPIAQLMPQPQAPVSLQTYAQQQEQQAALEHQKALTAHTQALTTGAGQENDIRARDLRDQEAMRKVFSAPDFDPDPAKVFKKMVSSGVSPKAAIGFQTSLTDSRTKLAGMHEAERKNLHEQWQQEQGELEGIEAAPPEQREALFQAARAKHPDLAHFQNYPGSDVMLPYMNTHKLGGALLTEKGIQAKQGLEAAQTDEAKAKALELGATTGKVQAETPGAKAKSDIEVRQAEAMSAMSPEKWDQQVDSAVPPTGDTKDLNQRTKALVKSAISMGLPMTAVQAVVKDASDQIGRTETAVRSAKATAPIKISVAAATPQAVANAAGVTDDDFRRAGQEYAMTGVMPAMGRGSFERGKIMHYKNEYARENNLSPKDLVTMQAAFAGDKDSLKKMQASRDQITSFEATAGKNLDMFLDMAEKLPDTGIPWINSPLRLLDEKLVGAKYLPAINAARQVANNEIAKVTSGGGLGGVLSDSARHEVGAFNPKDATLAQTIEVARVLKKDMANRHDSLDATLAEIKNRMGGTGAPAATTGAPKDPLGIR